MFCPLDKYLGLIVIQVYQFQLLFKYLVFSSYSSISVLVLIQVSQFQFIFKWVFKTIVFIQVSFSSYYYMLQCLFQYDVSSLKSLVFIHVYNSANSSKSKKVQFLFKYLGFSAYYYIQILVLITPPHFFGAHWGSFLHQIIPQPSSLTSNPV